MPADADLAPLDPSKSIRQQIIEKIEAAFLGVANNDDYGDFNTKKGFSTVNVGPLDEPDQRRRYTVGIVAGSARDSDKSGFTYTDLPIDIEFRVTVNTGDRKPGIMFEEALTVVRRVMMADGQWGGIAISTTLNGDESDLRTYLDKSIVGVVHTVVQFRTSPNDPRDPNPDFG